MNTCENNVLNQMMKHMDNYLESHVADSTEHYVEVNLWRLPAELIIEGITSIKADEERDALQKVIKKWQDTFNKKANWLIYAALEDHSKVINLALERYGLEVFQKELWYKYPELIQNIAEKTHSKINVLETQITQQNTKNDIEKVMIVFDDYLKNSKDIVVLYSEKIGYLCLTTMDPLHQTYAADHITSGEELCFYILTMIKIDYLVEHNLEDFSLENDWIAFWATLTPYLEQLPEYVHVFKNLR